MLGKGTFGQVVRANHRKANVACAVKRIEKKSISEHQILTELMHNELKVLEETVLFSVFIVVDPSSHHEDI